MSRNSTVSDYREGQAATSPLRSEVEDISDVFALMQRLKGEIPEVPWVIVTDGIATDFSKTACAEAKAIRETSKFWLVGAGESDVSSAITATSLNPHNAEDDRFLRNLVADLVIVSKEPTDSQQERLDRWLNQARYIVLEDSDASLQLPATSRARLFVSRQGRLNAV